MYSYHLLFDVDPHMYVVQMTSYKNLTKFRKIFITMSNNIFRKIFTVTKFHETVHLYWGWGCTLRSKMTNNLPSLRVSAYNASKIVLG